MWTKEDENWWFSTQKGLDFKDTDADVTQDDECIDISPDEFVESALFNATSKKKKNIYPIEKIVSKEGLQNILYCSCPASTVVPSVDNVEKVVNDLIWERQVSFKFRALSEKVNLLDKAIETKRGNVIKKVVVYLDKTLLPKIFYPLLISRPIALNHLELHYLKKRRLEALGTLYTMTGETNTCRLFAAHCPPSTKTSKNLISLQNFQLQYHPLLSHFEADALKKYRALLEYQVSKNVTQFTTARELFVECVKKNDFDKIDEDISKLHLSTEQADWVIMNVYMHEKKYDRLEKRFLQKNKTSWLKNLAFKWSLQPDTLILGMAEHKPEKIVLEPFLSLVKDDKKFVLGHKLGCYDYVIRLYCDKRDRNGLISYKLKFPNNSQFLEVIDKVLDDYSIKWKN